MKEKFFQIFFCVFIFWEAILYSFMGESGDETTGEVMRYALVAITVVSCFFYVITSPKYISEIKMILLLVLFAGLYFSTQFFYQPVAPDVLKLYNGQLLRWGAGCVSACLVGMTLMKLKNYDLIHKIMPLEAIALTPFMLFIILQNSHSEGQYVDEGGLNYQILAYNMAVLFCVSFFYSFIYKIKGNFIVRIISLLAMLVQSVACCMSGGRGGLVLLIVYICYMSYYILKRKLISKWKLFLGTVFCIIGFIYIANKFEMWTSSGFERSSGLVDDDDRTDMWIEIWRYITENNYMPYGLGGDYFTFGFYTHNILIDWILELGIVGALLMLYLYLRTYINLFKLTKKNEIFVIIMILFIYGVVMNMFSGYWITQDTNWMAFGIAMTAINYNRWHKKIKRRGKQYIRILQKCKR